MWVLYQIATILALLVAGPWLLVRRGRHYLGSLPGRMGRYSDPPPPAPLWIHAVSVGEVGVAQTLTKGLPADLPLLVTTVTPTGQMLARRLLGDRAAIAYLPFDLGPPIEKFLGTYSPRALICVEGDLWPLVLDRATRQGLPIAVVNGRVSDRSFRRMRKLRWLLGPIFGPVNRFGMQTDQDRQRLLDLGLPADRVTVTGNLKFETPPPDSRPELFHAIQALATGRPILVAGSTMNEEESAVLAAFRQLGGGEQALLVLAPRHPERWNSVASQIRAEGWSMTRRTEIHGDPSPTDVLLLDSLGELAAVYGVGLGCFIGGTLVPTGGHNPLEAAIHGVAIAVGRSMENFREIASVFETAGAWRQVDDAAQLAETWREWLADPDAAAALGQRGRAVIAANQGSLDRTIDLLHELVSLDSKPGVALPEEASR